MSARKAAAPKPATRIVGHGNGHSYLLDGEKVPGVTTILKQSVPMPALVGWAGRTVAEYVMDRLVVLDDGTVTANELLGALRKFNETGRYPERLGDGFSRMAFTKLLARVMYADRDAAANKGTKVHTLAQRIASGEDDVEVPEELERHVLSYERFLDEWRPTNAILEGVVVSRKWRYMGRFDLIADLPRVVLPDGSSWGGRTLLDLKTSRSGPYGEDSLQLAGYRYAETLIADPATGEEAPLPPVESTGILHVRADGYDLYPFTADERVFRIFLYAIQVGTALDQETGLVGTARGDALKPPVLEEPTP
jgi:hypothetical protein